METPKPMQGTWTLTAPDGRTWQAESPLRCAGLEQRERVPPEVGMARVLAMADEPDFAERHVQLGKFYGAANVGDLVDKMEHHIGKLQQKLAEAPRFIAGAFPSRVREG